MNKGALSAAFMVACFLIAIRGFADGEFLAYLTDSDQVSHEANADAVELEYREKFNIQILMPKSEFPKKAQPLGCLVKEIDITASDGKTVYDKATSIGQDVGVYTEPFTIEQMLRGSDLSVTSSNVDKMSIALKVVYWANADKDLTAACSGLAAALEDKEHTDTFVIHAKHYGPYLLVDLSPLKGTQGGALGNALMGIFSTLQLASIDVTALYDFTAGSPSFSYALLTAPIFYYQTREWYKHFDIEAVVAKDLGGASAGVGVALGLFRPTDQGAILKIGGVFLQATDWAGFIGVSISALSAWAGS